MFNNIKIDDIFITEDFIIIKLTYENSLNERVFLAEIKLPVAIANELLNKYKGSIWP